MIAAKPLRRIWSTSASPAWLSPPDFAILVSPQGEWVNVRSFASMVVLLDATSNDISGMDSGTHRLGGGLSQESPISGVLRKTGIRETKSACINVKTTLLFPAAVQFDRQQISNDAAFHRSQRPRA
jgi:hypothetical protein